MAFSLQTEAVSRHALPEIATARVPRILYVIPGEEQGPSMIFAKRQVAAIQAHTQAICQTFYLGSRTSPTRLWQERRRFRAEVKAFQPDIVHAHFGTMTAFFCVVSSRRPLVITYRGSDLNPSPSDPVLRTLLGHAMSQFASLFAARIICVSEPLRQRLLWNRHRAMIISSGVDTAQFYPRARAGARAEMGWSEDEKIVLFNAGKTPRVKRLDLAQAAVEAARKRAGDIRFVVMDGYVEPNQVPILMNAADCLVFTSDFEGAPTVIQEALACNLPIVSVEVGDVPGRLVGIEPSCLVPRDPEQIGAALSEILNQSRRSNGWEKAQALSLDNLSHILYGVYLRILARKS